ncbi:MAG: molybdopterin oxidoreductase family protein [Alphaproteobacteria bacterium]|nr:molybdopterin oxidoreductase family protein [Alphaproteobacteria bacterium]
MDGNATLGFSACPHDCPSTCALEIELQADGRIGRVYGAKDNTYTDGVICAKVARYAERLHHPDRLMYPMRRKGGKASAEFERISWDDALDITAEALLAAEAQHGPEAVWPYYFAGTMGLVMRDGINRLRHAKRYSDQHSSICTTLAWTGFAAGTGALRGADPREMAKSDCVVIWGTNPVNTQVNVMTHAVKARKQRGAKIVAIDVYNNGTMKQADMALCLKPGTDGALACAVMHILFRDNHCDRAFLKQYTDVPAELEAHLATRTPEWAAVITGLSVAEIEAFARLVGTTPRTFFRLGYGFSRQRNGTHNMHAALCIPAVTGAWAHEGGGAFHTNGAIFHWNKTLIEGLDVRDEAVRTLDMSRIGPILTGDIRDLGRGPPVTALFIQNMNPVQVAPDQTKVKAGFARDDLFVCVHEQFMTATARMADIVLPATMFVEHDDVYQGGGQNHIMLGPKLIEAPGECRSNHDVICALAQRVGASHPGFEMTAREIIDHTLQASGWGTIDELEASKWIDCQPDFETAHYRNGFAYPDGRFRFKPDWENVPVGRKFDWGIARDMPRLPDHWDVIENADENHPFRLATSPARGYLNSSFNETPTSRAQEGEPSAFIHPDDLLALGIASGDRIRMGNQRGEIELVAEAFDGVRRGVVIVESIKPNDQFAGGRGINTLTSADAVAPYGGAAFHDNHVWIKAGS